MPTTDLAYVNIGTLPNNTFPKDNGRTYIYKRNNGHIYVYYNYTETLIGNDGLISSVPIFDKLPKDEYPVHTPDAGHLFLYFKDGILRAYDKDLNEHEIIIGNYTVDTKVDKILGKSLVSDIEIEKLSKQIGINTGDQDLTPFIQKDINKSLIPNDKLILIDINKATISTEISDRIKNNVDLEAKIIGITGGQLGSLTYDSIAPTPGKNGTYIFSNSGIVSWLTGTPTVISGDVVAVDFISPVHTYKLLATSDKLSKLPQVITSIEQDQVKKNIGIRESNLNEKPVELITADIRAQTATNIGYITSNNGFSTIGDPAFRYTPLIKVTPGKDYNCKSDAPEAYCTFGYEDLNYRNPILLASSLYSAKLTMPLNINYLQTSVRYSNIGALSITLNTDTYLFEKVKSEILLKSDILNAVSTNTEFITDSIYQASIGNSGFIDANNNVQADGSYIYTPYIRIYPGIYTVDNDISGGASIIVCVEDNDITAKHLNISKINNKIIVPEGYNYTRLCTYNIRRLSIKNDNPISITYTKDETLSLVKDASDKILKGTSLITSATIFTNGDFINTDGDIAKDPTYTRTGKLKVYKGMKVHIKGFAGNGYCIGGYKSDSIKATSILKNSYTDTVLNINDKINYIDVSCRIVNLPMLEIFVENTFSTQASFEDVDNLVNATNIENLIHEKGRELITDEIFNATVLNPGWLDNNNVHHTDVGWWTTPFINVYFGTYLADVLLNGSASINGYNKEYKFLGSLKMGNIGDGMLAINGILEYIKLSTNSIDRLSLKAVESLFNYKLQDNYNIIPEFTFYNNLKNSQNSFDLKEGNTLFGKYSHTGTGYSLPIIMNRPTAISFKFKINEDVNAIDKFSELLKLDFINGDNVIIDLMSSSNTIGHMTANEDSWVSYNYDCSTPRYNSGFRISKTINNINTEVSIEKRFLTRKKPLVGKDAFHIRIGGILNATHNNVSLKIDNTNLTIFKGAVIIVVYPLNLTSPVKELTDRIQADITSGILNNYELETFGIETRLQSELLKVTEIKIATDNYYGGLQSWGAYVPYAIDESWHTCEVYADNMIHNNPVYTNLFIPVFIVAIDGVQTEIYPNSTLYGNCVLSLNSGGLNIECRDLDIQDGHADNYERIDEPTVAKFISKYSKRIIGLMGHHVLKTEKGSELINNSGYAEDMSTDRIITTKREADQNGYTMITIKDLADYYDGLKNIPNKCFFWTFDDIEIDIWYNKSIREIFINNGITPNLALVNSGVYTDESGRIDHDNINVEDFYLAHVDAIKDMRSYGWIPHMHGYNHSQVDSLKYDDFIIFLNNGQTLGETQGMYTDIYTYSYGPHSVNTAKYMEHKGIRLAVTTTNILSNNATGRYCISRINSTDKDIYPIVGLFRDWMDF